MNIISHIFFSFNNSNTKKMRQNKMNKTAIFQRLTSIVSHILCTWLAVCELCGPKIAATPLRRRWHTIQKKRQKKKNKILFFYSEFVPTRRRQQAEKNTVFTVMALIWSHFVLIIYENNFFRINRYFFCGTKTKKWKNNKHRLKPNSQWMIVFYEDNNYFFKIKK